MRAIQLVCYYTKAPAPEADRIRIQANIDRIKSQRDACQSQTLRSSYDFSIMALEGKVKMPRG